MSLPGLLSTVEVRELRCVAQCHRVLGIVPTFSWTPPSLFPAFSTWQQAAEDSRAAAAAAALAAAALQRVFCRWHAATALAQQKQQRVAKAAAWAFGNNLQKAWRAWAAHHAVQRKKHAAQALFQGGMLRRCLVAWRELVVRRQRLAVKEEHLQAAGARRRLAAALLQWHHYARARRFVRRLYTARAFAQWAANTAEMQASGGVEGLGSCCLLPAAGCRCARLLHLPSSRPASSPSITSFPAISSLPCPAGQA